MAEQKPENKETKIKKQTETKKEDVKGKLIRKEEYAGKVIRIMQTDIPGNKNVYAGLTRIKGISWCISNAVCILSKMDKKKKIENLTKEEIQIIEDTIRKANFPPYLLNRRKDFNTGESSHLTGSNFDIAEELDVKRLKKIRSFRGLRHAMGQPTRGQRTKSHFRANRKKGVGVKGKKTKPEQSGGEKK